MCTGDCVQRGMHYTFSALLVQQDICFGSSSLSCALWDSFVLNKYKKAKKDSGKQDIDIGIGRTSRHTCIFIHET